MNNEYWVCMRGDKFLNIDSVWGTRIVNEVCHASRYKTLTDLKSIACRISLKKHNITPDECRYVKINISVEVVDETSVDNEYRDSSSFHDDIPY